MLLNLDGLHMQAREIRNHRRQSFIYSEDPMVDIGECVLRYGRLLWLPQATVASVHLGRCGPVSYTHLDVYKRQPFEQWD